MSSHAPNWFLSSLALQKTGTLHTRYHMAIQWLNSYIIVPVATVLHCFQFSFVNTFISLSGSVISWYRAHPAISQCSHLLLKCRVATNISYSLGDSKITYLRKSVFWSAFRFSNIAFIIPSHFIFVPYFTLWMLDFFNTIRVSNSLDPDQARHFVGPDLGPNCMQRLSADNKSRP